jgi:hypothetical protein
MPYAPEGATGIYVETDVSSEIQPPENFRPANIPHWLSSKSRRLPIWTSPYQPSVFSDIGPQITKGVFDSSLIYDSHGAGLRHASV